MLLRTGSSAAALFILCCLLQSVLWPAMAIAQEQKRQLPAVAVDQSPILDGDVINDPAWQAATATGGFIQTTPDEGMPASQRTEVRVIYTAEAIYFGFVLYDDEPAAIVASDARRDASLSETDSVLLILDTYRDEQNGFVFGTNPNGLLYDGQLSKAGQGTSLSGGSSGAGGGFNLNWDGVWEVRTEMGEYGWSAEFRIPFNTIRYPSMDIQSWGVNFQRNIIRRNETAYWSPLGRQFNLLRLADAGLLTSLEIGSQRNLKIVPYVLAEVSDVGDAGNDTDTEWGLDVKYSLTPSLTLDLTYNTDFAQVEADESQVSLDRFNLFFPEKRPFFLENAGLFAVGKARQVELFFSRRIGLSKGGDIIPIDYGARVSGALAGVNIGAMYMQTDELDQVTPTNRFGVARINKELPNRSSLGAIFVSREAKGDFPGLVDSNRTYGADARWGIGEYGLISGYVASTSTPGLEGDENSWSLAADYDSERWSLGADFVKVGEDFNPEVGFLNRSGGYRNYAANIMRRYRPDNSRIGLLEIRPHASYRGYWTLDGFQENGFLHIDNHLVWKNGYEFHSAVNFTTEGLRLPYEISDGIFVPPGTYRNSEVHLYGQTNEGAWISFSASLTVGGFYNGDRVAFSPSMRMRLGEHFTTEIGWSQNNVDLPQGDFTTQVGRFRLSYSFTPQIALEALLQYNNVDDFFSTNLRFSWLRKANTGLYVVFNDINGHDRYTGEQPDRSLIVKYTHMFDVF